MEYDIFKKKIQQPTHASSSSTSTTSIKYQSNGIKRGYWEHSESNQTPSKHKGKQQLILTKQLVIDGGTYIWFASYLKKQPERVKSNENIIKFRINPKIQ